MKRLSSAQFRRSYAQQAAPVEVTAYDKVIGTWYPVGVETPLLEAEEPASEPRFSIRPMKRPRPNMVGHVVPVRDPLEVRAHERETQDEFQPRVFKTRRT